jgi:hypothetical protein
MSTEYPIDPNGEILCITRGNFVEYEKQLKKLCVGFGTAGQQILDGKATVPYFAAEPNINDTVLDKDGNVLRATYKREIPSGWVHNFATTGAAAPATAINIISARVGAQTRSMTRAAAATTTTTTTTTTTITSVNAVSTTAATAESDAKAAITAIALYNAERGTANEVSAKTNSDAAITTALKSAAIADAALAKATSATVASSTTTASIIQVDERYLALEPTENAMKSFQDNRKEWKSDRDKLIDSDNKALRFLIGTHSKSSITGIEASINFGPYPPNCHSKSLLFWEWSKSVHQNTAGSVKFGRTREIFQRTQGDKSHAEHIVLMARDRETLVSDWGQHVDVPGVLKGDYININHLMSLVYLTSLDQAFFGYPINRMLEKHPDGRIDNFGALMNEFHQYNLSKEQTTTTTITNTDLVARVLTAKVGSTSTGPTSTNTGDSNHNCTICSALGYYKASIKHDTVDCPGNREGNHYNKKAHAVTVAFAKNGFKRPVAAVTATATTAVPTTVVPTKKTGGVYDSDQYKRARAHLTACPEGTDEWLAAAAALTNIVSPETASNNST